MPEVCLGCRSKCSDELAVVACTSPSAGDKRGLLLVADELKAKDKSVKEDKAETEDRGLLLADGVRLYILSIETDPKKLEEYSNIEKMNI